MSKFTARVKLKRLIPNGITAMRLLAAPLFYCTFLNCSCAIAFTVFVLAAVSDMIDGYAARKLDTASTAGAFFDVLTDFILIVVVFAAFLKKDWYCVFIYIPILFSFVSFMVSSGTRKPLYDPIGKHMGSAVMIMIVVTLLIPYPLTRKILTYGLAAFFIVSQASRAVFLIRKTE